jgi:hypothetical protein
MKPQLESLIARFEAGGELLKYAVGGLTEEHAKAHPGPGEWSIAEVAAHLTDSDLVGGDRMKRVIAEENPSLPAFDENAWLTRLRSGEMPVDESVALFDIHRKQMSRILRGCSEQDFSRAGMHSERGRMTLAELLTVFVNHLDHHLKFIFAKRANLGVSIHPRYTYDPN